VLTPDDISAVHEQFGIYDHEWRAYAPLLGEPYLVDGYLLYFDGIVVYVCAYRLGDTTQVLSETAIKDTLRGCPQFADARAIVIWGQFDAPLHINHPGDKTNEPLKRVMFVEYDTTSRDSVIDIAAFDHTHARWPRAACNKVRRSALVATTTQQDALHAEHLGLIDEWSSEHAIEPFHAALAASVAYYIRDPCMYLTEARLDGRLVGFAVLSMSSHRHAVFLQNFNSRQAGLPIGDAIYAEMLRFAREHDANFLHLGYSATPGLLRFKRKWGARCDQPPYREAGFTNDVSLGTAIKARSVTWQQRLLARASHGEGADAA
jgi:hypothetical protein